MIHHFSPPVDRTVARSKFYPATLVQVTAVLHGSRAAYKCLWLVNADGRVFSKTRLLDVPFTAKSTEHEEFLGMLTALSGGGAIARAEISFGEFDSYINDAHDLTHKLMIGGHSVRVTSLRADGAELLGTACEVYIDDNRSISTYIPTPKGAQK